MSLPIVRLGLAIASATSLTSCSLALSLEVLNNSGRPVEICSASATRPNCISLDAGYVGELSLYATALTLEWELTVRAGTDVEIFAISLNGKREFAPDEICGRMFAPCRIAFQLERNMLVYWVEKHRRSPADEFPEQPDGFPIAPAA